MNESESQVSADSELGSKDEYYSSNSSPKEK